MQPLVDALVLRCNFLPGLMLVNRADTPARFAKYTWLGGYGCILSGDVKRAKVAAAASWGWFVKSPLQGQSNTKKSFIWSRSNWKEKTSQKKRHWSSGRSCANNICDSEMSGMERCEEARDAATPQTRFLPNWTCLGKNLALQKYPPMKFHTDTQTRLLTPGNFLAKPPEKTATTLKFNRMEL